MISGLILFCIWKYTDDICIRLPMHFIMYWSVTVHMSLYVFSFYRFLYIVHLAFLIFFEILIILHLAFLIFWKSIMSFLFFYIEVTIFLYVSRALYVCISHGIFRALEKLKYLYQVSYLWNNVYVKFSHLCFKRIVFFVSHLTQLARSERISTLLWFYYYFVREKSLSISSDIIIYK